MTQGVRVVRRFLSTLERDDVDAALACLDERVYFVPPADEVFPRAGDFSGHDGFRDWWEAEFRDRVSLVPIEIEQVDDRHVFAEVMVGAFEGQTYVSRCRAWVCTVEDQAINAIELFHDPLRARTRIATAAVSR
jgi:ketosteroid isomerase-like protein